VWANATAAPYGEEVTATLVAQLTAPVRFAETLTGIARTGVTRFVHIGPGDVTAGLATRSVQGTEAIVVSSLDDVGPAADRLARP
jgi:malonyl CoA-acyl carrier protein transacylase